MREIVAARFDDYVTNNPLTIQKMIERDSRKVEFFDRTFAERMARIFDHWKAIATGATLFLMDENGLPCAPTRKEVSR
jgi:hypothetical protein